MIVDQIEITDALEVTDWIRERLNSGDTGTYVSFVSFRNQRRWLSIDEALLAWSQREELPICRLPKPFGRHDQAFSLDEPPESSGCDWDLKLVGTDADVAYANGHESDQIAYLTGLPVETTYEMVRRSIERRYVVSEQPTFAYADGVPLRPIKGSTAGSAGFYAIGVRPELEVDDRLHVLLHELVHIAADHSGPEESEDHSNRKEVVAETGAYLLLTMLGHALADWEDYIRSWGRRITTEGLYDAITQIEPAVAKCLDILATPPWQGPRDPFNMPRLPLVPLPGAIEAVDD